MNLVCLHLRCFKLFSKICYSMYYSYFHFSVKSFSFTLNASYCEPTFHFFSYQGNGHINEIHNKMVNSRNEVRIEKLLLYTDIQITLGWVEWQGSWRRIDGTINFSDGRWRQSFTNQIGKKLISSRRLFQEVCRNMLRLTWLRLKYELKYLSDKAWMVFWVRIKRYFRYATSNYN